MGWFSSSPARVSAVKEITPEEAEVRKPLLEDLEPKFQDSAPEHAQKPTISEAIVKVQLSDFTLEKYMSMPCFREAMLTGFQAMGVLGVVTLLIHKDPNRSVRWGLGGFLLGNIMGWEQCRSLRRRSFQNMERARKVNQDGVRRHWEKKMKKEEAESEEGI